MRLKIEPFVEFYFLRRAICPLSGYDLLLQRFSIILWSFCAKKLSVFLQYLFQYFTIRTEKTTKTVRSMQYPVDAPHNRWCKCIPKNSEPESIVHAAGEERG